MYQKNYLRDKLRSAHLYQLLAYLRNLGDNSEGILLYPTAGVALDQIYILQEHRVRVTTIDLTRSWRDIAAGLLALITGPEPIG